MTALSAKLRPALLSAPFQICYDEKQEMRLKGQKEKGFGAEGKPGKQTGGSAGRRRPMNHKFFDVSKEKQDRIINAALQVFAQNGYRHAGTDEVVKRASISKGLLFHYFESKLGLYVFLYDYAVKFMLLELSGGLERTENDLFCLVRFIEEASLRACRQYPYLKAFLFSVQEEDSREALQAVEEQKAQYEKRLGEILRQADARLLRPRADQSRTLKIMEYTFRGLTREHCRRESFSPEELFGEIFSYLRLFERLLWVVVFRSYS